MTLAPPTPGQEQQLLAKYGLPPNTNREVLLRVLSSLNAAQSAAATTSAGVHSSSAGRGQAPWRAAGSAQRPTSRPVTPVNEFREPWSVAKPASASRSQEAERVASRRRVEELQAELDQRTVRLQATEAALAAQRLLDAHESAALAQRTGGSAAQRPAYTAARSASAEPPGRRQPRASRAAPPLLASMTSSATDTYVKLLPARRPVSPFAVKHAPHSAHPSARALLGGSGSLTAEALFAQDRPADSHASPVRAGGRVSAGQVVPSALKALQANVSQRGVAALQARVRELTKHLSGEESRRRAADEERAAAEGAAREAYSREARTRRECESLHRQLEEAQQEIAVKEAECTLLAQLVQELRAQLGTHGE